MENFTKVDLEQIQAIRFSKSENRNYTWVEPTEASVKKVFFGLFNKNVKAERGYWKDKSDNYSTVEYISKWYNIIELDGKKEVFTYSTVVIYFKNKNEYTRKFIYDDDALRFIDKLEEAATKKFFKL